MADMARKHAPAWYGCGCSICADKRQRRKERKSAKLKEKRDWRKDWDKNGGNECRTN